MKRYWETQVELVFTLKGNVASSSLADSMVKPKLVEGVFVVGVEGFFHAPIISMLPRWQ